MTAARRVTRDERGTALLLAMVLSGVLAAVAAVVALTARTETLLAGSFQQGRETAYAAEGALARGLADLEGPEPWSDVLAGGLSSFVVGDPAPARALENAVRRAANGGRSWGSDTPHWRLFAWGPASAWLPPGKPEPPFQLAVWIADDPEDGDGDPAADANGVVALYAVATSPTGARRSVRATVARPRDERGIPLANGVRLLTQAESRW